jgi:hypothetical protein
MPQNVPGTPGRFTRKCQPMPPSHSYQRWGGRFFSRNCLNHRPIREPVVLIRVAMATSASVHCPFFGLVEHHGGEVQSGPLRRLLRRSERSAIGGKPGFCANSGSGGTAASARWAKRSVPMCCLALCVDADVGTARSLSSGRALRGPVGASAHPTVARRRRD